MTTLTVERLDRAALHSLLALARQTGLERVTVPNGGYAWKSSPRSIALPYVVTAERGPDGDYWLISAGKRDFIAQTWDELLAVLRLLAAFHVLPKQFAEVAS